MTGQKGSFSDVPGRYHGLTAYRLFSLELCFLTKGDKLHNDPANGIKGTIYTVEYYGNTSIEFRKHNSKLLYIPEINS